MSSEESQRKLYGRRVGRPLRPSLRRLVEEELPPRAIALPERAGAPLDPHRLFSHPPAQVWLEIGFGGGEHLAEQAEAHPQAGIIGVEYFRNGIASLLRACLDRNLDNVRILEDDARLLLDHLPADSLDRVFLLFPDPWPKTRHHKRRFIQRATLDKLATAMKPGSEFRLASDDPGYQAWMLRHLLDHPAFEWTARRPRDWQIRPHDWPGTRYEEKAIADGRQPIFLKFRRR
ncbi:tRNA (guanosine(46)-N7)-methyltransferase TrmB [Fodinicurvata halophila]|uniref:tRNA (guanine-N(7)-)-methyltransferase n=1 Tax=Fodinicurvata halophila TaxID=1419723 RepID=A0ABV8UN23_9PROT